MLVALLCYTLVGLLSAVACVTAGRQPVGRALLLATVWPLLVAGALITTNENSRS